MRNVSDKRRRENRNTHLVFSNFFFSFENATVYEIMWKNFVERVRSQMKIWCMRIACWISKATSTHTQVVLYSLLSHCNNGYTNAPQCYVIRTLLVVYNLPPFCIMGRRHAKTPEPVLSPSKSFLLAIFSSGFGECNMIP